MAAEGLAQGVWQYTDMKRPPGRPSPQSRADRRSWSPTSRRRPTPATGSARPSARGRCWRAASRCSQATCARPPTSAGAAEELAKRHGFAVTVLDKAAITREKMGGLLAVAQGSAEEPRFIVLEYKGADRAAGRAGREGRHVRHRRHLDQAGAEHGGHEVRHVRRRGGARHLRDARSAQAGGARRRAHSEHREHALRHRRQARRRHHQPPRQDDRDHQHRRRRPADPLRRAVVGAALPARLRAGHRHADGRHRRRPGTHGRRRDGHRRPRSSRRSAPRASGPGNGSGPSRSGTNTATS